jgi:O-glycosyl hydrolase
VSGPVGEQGGKPNHYPDFANHMADWVQRFKSEVGIDLYAITPQNEPDFAQSYASCVYSAGQMRDVIQYIGAEMEERGLWPTTRINMAERMLSHFMGTIGPYSTEVLVMNDETAAKYIDMVSVHGYSDGVSPLGGTEAQRYWQGAYNFANGGNGPLARVKGGKKLQLWMTETSGYIDWNGGECGSCGLEGPAPGAFTLAQDMYKALKYGKISLWTWWRVQVSSVGWTDETLVLNGNRLKNYYVSKQYFKYIRPGAVQIDVDDSGDENVGIVGFHHPELKTLTLVCINKGSSSAALNLTGPSLPAQYASYVTTASKECVSEGSVSAGSLTLEPQSVTTLVGSNYTPDITSIGSWVTQQPTATYTRPTTYDIIGLTGRKMASGLNDAQLRSTLNRLPGGRYFVIGRDIVSQKMVNSTSRIAGH